MADLIKAMQWRYAVKQFDPVKRVSKKNIETILEAGRLSPSSLGLQPWRFLVIENRMLREKLKMVSYNQPKFSDASHIIVIAAPKRIDEQYIEKYLHETARTRHQSMSSLDGLRESIVKSLLKYNTNRVFGPLYRAIWGSMMDGWFAKQCYIALGSMMAAAALMRIDTCPMEGFRQKEYASILDLTEYDAVAVLAVGYRDRSDPFAAKKKVRFPFKDIVQYYR